MRTLRRRSSPEASFFGIVAFGLWFLLWLPVLYLMMPYHATLSEVVFFGALFGTMVLACIFAYPITQWYFHWRFEPKPEKLQIGKGDGEYHALQVPMQCVYCGTSLQPSSSVCPKCGRNN